ncbi:uncharacterized protein BDV14DRAFT_6784 [Aspergillus stella-maris]|uniref:uncharacterized protein n=1 Tax=Aspergillus stella-maris TaxID=1810926 RepID=UPI003CCDF296
MCHVCDVALRVGKTLDNWIEFERAKGKIRLRRQQQKAYIDLFRNNFTYFDGEMIESEAYAQHLAIAHDTIEALYPLIDKYDLAAKRYDMSDTTATQSLSESTRNRLSTRMKNVGKRAWWSLLGKDVMVHVLDQCEPHVQQLELLFWKYGYRRDIRRTVLAFQSPSLDEFQCPSDIAPLYIWFSQPSPSVGDRVAIAYDLTTSMHGLYRLGWVHCNVKRDTIWLGRLEGSDPKRVPFVAGWHRARDVHEWAGANDGDNRTMDKLHEDFKAVGKILMDIGLWQQFADNKGKKRADGLMERPINNCSQGDMNLLRAAMGSYYTAAVEYCFECDSEARRDSDRKPAHVLASFKRCVIDVLAAGCRA